MAQTHTPPSTYILRDLHDVAVPESVSWLPQTLGWKILAAVCFVLFLCWLYRIASHWWHNRYRSEAAQAISQLQFNQDSDAKELFSIMKIVLIYLDNSNAPLFDEKFLHKLDKLNPKGVQFTDDVSKRWVKSIFDPNISLDASECALLKQRALAWMKSHNYRKTKPLFKTCLHRLVGEKYE